MTRSFAPPPRTLTLFAILLSVDVTVLLAEKVAARTAGMALGHESTFYLQLTQIWWTWLGVGLGPVQLFLWTKILKKTDLSLAYCITSLCYPLTMIASVALLQEQIGWQAWVGAVFVTFGAALIGSDEKISGEKEAFAQPMPPGP